MEVRTAATFLRVSELQSITKAARELGYSQGAVTIQIQQLEQELGVPLFERIGRKVRLTREGTAFLPLAMELVRAARQSAAFPRTGDDLPVGQLRIGTAESLFMSVLSPILPQFHRRCPQVETIIHTGRIAQLFEMIQQNDVDLLFFLDKKTHSPQWVKVFERPEPILFVAPAGHPLAGKKKISLERALEEPFLLTEKGVSYRYDLEQLVASRGAGAAAFSGDRQHRHDRPHPAGGGRAFLPAPVCGTACHPGGTAGRPGPGLPSHGNVESAGLPQKQVDHPSDGNFHPDAEGAAGQKIKKSGPVRTASGRVSFIRGINNTKKAG